jgi:hypothetical protein
MIIRKSIPDVHPEMKRKVAIGIGAGFASYSILDGRQGFFGGYGFNIEQINSPET